MAAIQNRSRIAVVVKNRPQDTRYFPYDAWAAAEAYADERRSKGYKPKSAQESDTWEVRIRQKGFAPQNVTCHSHKEAETFVKKVESERATGLFRDYTKAHRTTFADLLVRYTREFNKKSAKVIAYKIEAWLADSGPRGLSLLEEHRKALRAAGTQVRTAHFQMRETIGTLEWIHKPLAQVTADDINGYIEARSEQVSLGTVDREIDTFSAVFRKATRAWGYHLADNPMDGVERPRFFNERDRRYKAGEEERLLTALRKLDWEHSVQAHVEALLDAEYENTEFSSLSAQKKVFAVRRKELRAIAEHDAEVTPQLETLAQFLVMTAARRGEALKLTWADIDFDARTAYLAETKNMRPRKLPLRSSLVDMLKRLPRTSDHVFDIGLKWLANMWKDALRDAGIEGLHIHDLRHEAISRVAETSKFGLVDLQAFSGHRDVRMLLRYSHLCASRMAAKLDEAFADEESSLRTHKGRHALKKNAVVKMSQLIEDAPNAAIPPQPQLEESDDHETCHPSGHNVIQFPKRRVA